MDGLTDRIEMPEGADASGGPTAVVDEPDEAELGRKQARWTYAGFGLGVLEGFVATAILVALCGYPILPILVWNLIWIPCLGLVIGQYLGRGHRTGPWKWKRPQLRTRTLMLVVAYVAFLCGMGVPAQRLRNSALQYFQKSVAADSMAKAYRGLARKSENDVRLRRANVAELGDGKIPDGLLPGQKEFLRSLEIDPKVTPEYREHRRGLIEEGEEQARTRQERNVDILRRLVEYHEQLAARYDRARWRPWLPVEPDPPLPPTQ